MNISNDTGFELELWNDADRVADIGVGQVGFVALPVTRVTMNAVGYLTMRGTFRSLDDYTATFEPQGLGYPANTVRFTNTASPDAGEVTFS